MSRSMVPSEERIGRDALERCFAGAIPVVVATASADAVPNVIYVSKAHRVDGERVALSNQFMSKTTRNLAERPRASLLVVDPVTGDEYRLSLTYERTERRGRVFEQLRREVDAIASMTGMQDVFRLRSADIFRVTDIEVVPSRQRADGSGELRVAAAPPSSVGLAGVAELCQRLARCADLDALVRLTMEGLGSVLGYEHRSLLLLDEEGTRLFTIASAGYDDEGVGSEVEVGDGIVGLAAARCHPVRVGNLQQMDQYSRRVRQSYEASGEFAPGREVPLPALPDAGSRLAVPAMALGRLVGVLVADSTRPAAFTDADESALEVIATTVAASLEAIRSSESEVTPAAGAAAVAERPDATSACRVRFFSVDGSTFLDGDYLIKGVAGRILWSLLGQYVRDGRVEFTNREMRLDPVLDLPDVRDNFESRLIMLKRRLDERAAPVRISKTGRGRFRLEVTACLVLEAAG